MSTTQQKIEARVLRSEPGSVFTPKDFLNLGKRGAVDVALSKLTSAGIIRRIARGLYEYPRTSTTLGGPLSPDPDQVARAIARKLRWRIVPHGALAANMLGLSTQVPARITYLSDGPTRRVPMGRQTILFKHARPKEMAVESPTSAVVIQALRYLGRDGVDRRTIKQLRNRLSKAECRKFLRDARFSADWIYGIAREVAEGGR